MDFSGLMVLFCKTSTGFTIDWPNKNVSGLLQRRLIGTTFKLNGCDLGSILKYCWGYLPRRHRYCLWQSRVIVAIYLCCVNISTSLTLTSSPATLLNLCSICSNL